ncbi:AsmA-like C-terminal region-containing protein [Flavobacterium sp. NRK F10]|uniref:AsmA-like C-terminal region-containing protein n=1 Tax=Flavobacterium sp. NRK F10 TaxID=2954931 RepID=UPI002091C6B0|nr:AsmA-like C-terminal region-containing protein [Flavobacterium sp. NRK F10]MCO6175448.1 AsmA-like C-terminal region-containing protein [Flavobacterium sp. NRK F10]
MKTPKEKTLKIVKIFLISFSSLILILLAFPFVFTNTITQKVKVTANTHLNGELNFKDSNLSFFKHFPSLTLTLNELKLNGSEPFKKQSLVNAKEVSLGINVFSLIFGQETEIDEIYLDDAKINIQVNRFGEANYNVYKSNADTTQTSSDEGQLKLKRIIIKNSELVYNDKSAKMKIVLKGLNYRGTGDLQNANFDLKTRAQIDQLSLTYDKKEYLKDKKVKADLITKINTNSLSFLFEKNDLIINKLPIEFSGFFDFISNGYKMDFKVKTTNSNLEDLFSALPPEFGKWVKDTKTKGKTDAAFNLTGDYIVSENKQPEIDFAINVRDGYIKHQNAPFPIENLYLNLETKLPNLDVSQLEVKLDSLYFDVNKNNLSAILKSSGFGDVMKIDSRIKSNLDLGFVSSALQIPNFELGGKLIADIVANGNYNARKRLFPKAKGTFNWENGTIKTTYYPNAIQNIQLDVKLNNPSGYFKDASLDITKGHFTFENEPFQLAAHFQNFDDVAYNIAANGTLNVGKIYQVFKVDGIDVNGKITANISLKGKQSDATGGNYAKLENKGTLSVQKIATRTTFLPLPFVIENGTFIFNQDNLNFNDFKGKYGSSDVSMNGYFQNAINFFLSDREVLKGNFKLNSTLLNTNEFFFTKEIQTQTESKKEKNIESTINQVMEVPTNLDLGFDLDARKLVYEDINIENITGKVTIQNGKIALNNGKLNIIDASALMNGSYENTGTQKANFDFKMKAAEFDIKRAYNEIKLFRELASSAENAEGIIGMDYAIKGVLNNKMEPIMPSLEGGGEITVKKVKMNNFRLMNVVSEKTEYSSLKDPDLSEIIIKSTIKNNIINIERFKAKVSLFRLRFEGQTSFDGNLNLKMRIGLPPLGIIGIPIKVTGTQDEPKIQLGKKTEDLEETIYDENAPENNTITPLQETIAPVADSTAGKEPLKTTVKDTLIHPLQKDSIQTDTATVKTLLNTAINDTIPLENIKSDSIYQLQPKKDSIR